MWGSVEERRVCQNRRAGVRVMPRPTILTQAALAHVTGLVDQGRSAAEIASEIGCTLGTLRVRCSQLGISLRRRATASRKEAMTAMDLVSPPRRVSLHGTNFLPEYLRPIRAQPLLANHRLRSASNLQFSCRELPLSNSDSAVRCAGSPAQLWPQNC
jgi:hypothetical protein